MAQEAFDFVGANGVALSGWLERPRTTPCGWAIFAHCFARNEESNAADGITAALARHGIGVLRLDFTSARDAKANFGGDPADIRAAAEAMAARGSSVGLLVGHSLGAMAVIVAASTIPSVRAVATLAAPAKLDPLIDQARPSETDTSIADSAAAEQVMLDHTGLLETLGQVDAVASMHDLDAALLLLHAPGDTVVPIDHATRLFVAARHPKSFVSLDDADHFLTRTVDVNFAAGIIAAWAARYLPQNKPDAQPLDIAPGAIATETGQGRFHNEILAGGVRFFADEPLKVGGLGSGPSPFDLICAGLAACTSMTLRMYAQRKNIPMQGVRTTVTHDRTEGLAPLDRLTARIHVGGDLNAQQRSDLLRIAARCPVHLMLVRGADIEDTLEEQLGS